MNAKLISKAIATSATASIMLLAGTVAQAAPSQKEISDFFEIQVLKEGGYSYPAIEEIVTARKAAARAEAEKATQPSSGQVARAKDDKAATKN